MTKTSNSVLRSVVERLSHSEERFRLLVESVQDYALFMLDPAGRVASWNQGAQRMKGYRSEEIVGRDFSQFYTREDIDAGRPDAALAQATTYGRFNDEGWRVRKDGSRFWASSVLTAMRDESGRLRGFAKVTRDLTERTMAIKRLSESETRLQAFMNHSPSVIFVKGLDGRYQYVNDQFCRSFGLKRHAVLGRTDAEIFSAEQSARFQANDATIVAAGIALEFEESAEYQDGQHVSIVCKFPIRDADGRVAALGGIVTDITARKRAESEALEAQKCPMPPNCPLVADCDDNPLEPQRPDRAEIDRDLDALVGMIARDLQPPLRNMESLAARMREGMTELVATALRLDRLTQAAAGLTKLTNDLLMYSRARRMNPAHHRSADLNAIVAEARRSIEAAAPSRRIRWIVASLPRVAGDPALLRIAIEHVLSNAVKFTQQRDPAVIEVAASAADGDEVVVEFKDNGIGFSEQQARKLFQPFQRLHNDNRLDGAGIGLVMAKRVIECAGGRIWAESRPGEGASFYLALRSDASEARLLKAGDDTRGAAA